MKIYKETSHVASCYSHDFHQAVNKIIQDSQMKGYQLEVQYSTCASGGHLRYSALILAYTEKQPMDSPHLVKEMMRRNGIDE